MNITNPAFNYEQPGIQYAAQRRTDPRIAAHIQTALNNANTIINIGAGAGSYEPTDRYVVAVEPSASMRAQRIANNKMPAINATAASLPFDDNAFDAAMAMVTVHHWPHLQQGLQEIRRVTKEQMIIMTFDPDALHLFWNAQYFPELIEVERQRYPTIETLTRILGGNCEVQSIPIPLDCVDGFQEAYYGRPEAFLQPQVRKSQSAWGFLQPGVEERLVQSLADELHSGEWDRKYGHYRTQSEFTGALRLIVARP